LKLQNVDFQKFQKQVPWSQSSKGILLVKTAFLNGDLEEEVFMD
jgi:hypothetical protein